MHKSASDHMQLCVRHYMPLGVRHRVVDLGSRISENQKRTHRDLLTGHDVEYVGVDVRDGENVDAVMPRPYTVPVKSRSADVVLSGQAFEHIPFFWASMLEIARVLRPGGYAFITAPSRGHVHDAQDCWRYYPDGFRAMAAYTALELCETYTDFPPLKGIRHDYASIDARHAYWGDSVGVFRKPAGREPLTLRLVRAVTVRWANRVGGVQDVPLPEPHRDRGGCGRPRAGLPSPDTA
ncbi:methyltransferase domain-containing protein [Streptomyces sp. ODS28]|uniref:methyltransferase domain-containing protein n=1 Tax=Streptomyces sp. ODS28 TaxID=3136688 RepID=UPI0031EAA230